MMNGLMESIVNINFNSLTLGILGTLYAATS